MREVKPQRQGWTPTDAWDKSANREALAIPGLGFRYAMKRDINWLPARL